VIPKEVIKKIRRIQIRTRHMVSDVFSGQYHSVFKGQGMEFHEVREYVPGDDIRSIDWNVTARMGHPFIKKFVEEREMTVMLMVDISASHDFGSSSQLKKDVSAELAAVLAFSAIQNNDRVGLILFSEDVELFIPPAKGVGHVLRLIREVLYHTPRNRGTRVEPALHYVNHILTRRAVTFLISDFLFSEDYEKILKITARRHDVVGLLVGDKREQSWPKAGLIDWIDTETGRRHVVDTSDARTRRILLAQQSARRRETLDLLRSCGIDTVQIYAGEPYDKELMKFFRTREARKRS